MARVTRVALSLSLSLMFSKGAWIYLDLVMMLGKFQNRLKNEKVKFDSIWHFRITETLKCPTPFQETLQTLLSSNLHPKPRAAECCQGSARSKANLQSTASASHASDSLHSGCPSFLHSKDGANRSHSGPGRRPKRPKAQLLETRCVTGLGTT